MRVLNKPTDPQIAILVSQKMNNLAGLIVNYTQKLSDDLKAKVVFIEVPIPEKGAVKKADFLKEMEEVEEFLETYGIEVLGVSIPDYFNLIAKEVLHLKKKVSIEKWIGRMIEYKGIKVTPLLNYLAVRVSPNKKPLLDKSIMTLDIVARGEYTEGDDPLKDYKITIAYDWKTAYKILKEWIDEEYLALDIETTGLKWYKDEMISVAFAIEKEAVTLMLHPKFTNQADKMKELLAKFIDAYKGRFILHNGAFDIPFLVNYLYMEDITDTENMIKGVNKFKVDDTMIMAYLCLNDYDRPKLSLKDLAYPKFGDWDSGIDQKNLINANPDDIGKYNGVDVLATYWLFQQFKNKLVDEEQDELYFTFYRRLLPAITKMKMNGLTIDKEGFEQLHEELEKIYEENLEMLRNTEYVKEAVELLKETEREKGKSENFVNKIVFNPKSTNHLRKLLFDVMGLEPIKFSKQTGEPSTDKEVLAKLLEQAIEDTEEWKILNALKEIGEMKTVKSTFVDGFLQKGVETKKGFKLFPDFKITGTLSGRMAGGGGINFLNIPSGSKYGKLIKKNIIAEEGYYVLQADSDQLEDRLITSTTGCVNKAKVFKLGLDAHASNSFAYWEDQMPDIKEQINKIDKASKFYLLKDDEVATDLDNVDKENIEKEITSEEYYVKVINSIKYKYPELRQASKPYTFKMAYGGITEFSEQYEKLYQEVFDFVSQTEKELLEKGYVKGFFGLKARCNLGSILDKHAYSSALRSLFNMRTQSGALIISQAIFLLQEWIEKQGWETKIKITNSVYDSIYIEIVDDEKIIAEVSNKLVEFMSPDYHKLAPQIPDEDCYIPLGAEAELGHSWVSEVTIPYPANEDNVKEKLKELKEE